MGQSGQGGDKGRGFGVGFLRGLIGAGRSIVDAIKGLVSGGAGYTPGEMVSDATRAQQEDIAQQQGQPHDPNLPLPPGFFKDRPRAGGSAYSYVYEYTYNSPTTGREVVGHFTLRSDTRLSPNELEPGVGDQLAQIETSAGITVTDVKLIDGYYNSQATLVEEIPF